MPTYSPAEQARQRATTSPAAQWRREAETWFDGSVESVDHRLAACDRLLAASREAVAHDGFGIGARKHLAAVEDLTDQRRVLAELRHDLLTAANDRHWDTLKYEAAQPLASLPASDRRWVELEAARFIRANADPSLDTDELIIRAKNHAALHTGSLPVHRAGAIKAALAERVLELRATQPRPRVAMAPSRSMDWAPELMFM